MHAYSLLRVSDPKKYTFTGKKQMLTVLSVKKSKDITCFQCYVSNSVGEEFGNGCLNVICKFMVILLTCVFHSVDF